MKTEIKTDKEKTEDWNDEEIIRMNNEEKVMTRAKESDNSCKWSSFEYYKLQVNPITRE
jgi:hypothetical protein